MSRPVADDLIVRAIHPSEAAAYGALRLEGIERHPELFRVAYADEAAVPLHVRAEILRTSHTMGAFVGGALSGIGSLSAFAGEKLCHKALLWGMYVRREASGRGVGEAIVRALLDHARERYDSVQLTAAADNARARALYERCGFVLYGIEPRSTRVGASFVDEALMWCRMSSANET